MTNTILEFVLEGLMRRYRERVPDVANIFSAMQEEGIIASIHEIENDHIAFRSLGVPQLGIQSLEKIFLTLGYHKRDRYQFPEKKLNAFWYSPPAPVYPRIFISELRVDELSESARAIIHKYTTKISADPVDTLDLTSGAAIDSFLHSPLWEVPLWKEYQALHAESEYAAWTIYNRYYLNHFTISVHNLPQGYNDIQSFCDFLEKSGFTLNNSGGKIKISADGLLRQASTVAAMVEATFPDQAQPQRIAGSYVEFAERRILPQYANLPAERIGRAQRREGFEVTNADKIFESTYSAQTGRAGKG
jgi:hypothetical protein